MILGGGFGGVYAAIHLEKLLARESVVEICLVSHDNFLLFTPMRPKSSATSKRQIQNVIRPIGRRSLLS
jgi:NADH dehydrogenase, FAD-containing subunit